MKDLLTFSSFIDMLEKLPNNKACREYLENVRWNGIPTCPNCGTADSHHYKLNVKGEFTGMYKCCNCKERFTVTIGTMFEGSHIPLRKWFIAIYIFQSHKKGISSHQLAKDLGITQKSAWFMLSRIRSVFGKDTPTETGGGEVQMDETFVGGKNKNRHADKKVKNSQGRSFKDKTPVFGILNEGKVSAIVIPDTKATTIQPIIYGMVREGSTIISDEWSAYSGLSRDYVHFVVNHGVKQYVTDTGHTTNAIENFWSHLKRGLNGVYHRVSPKHLQLYCNEFTFRFNNRGIKEGERFNHFLKTTQGEKLKYKTLIKSII